MKNNVQSLIDTVANEADELLQGVSTAAEAKPLLLEWLADNHPELPKDARVQVVQSVIAILQDEEFFTTADNRAMMADASEVGEPDE